MPFDGTNLSDVKRTLINARELVEKGWCKGRLENKTKNGTSYCAVGAINRVIYRDGPDTPQLERDAKEAFRSAQGLPSHLYMNIERWNDARGRSKVDVLAAFDKAIAIVE